METKNCRNVVVDLQEWLGYDYVYTVNPVGLSGGLALFWKKGVNIEFLFVDKNLLDLRVQFGGCDFFITCVYGDPLVKGRARVWERLSRIGIVRKDCWCVVGDFNDILNNSEKIGGPLRGDSSFTPFKDMINSCELLELSSKGNGFTWGGKRFDLWIQSRLDRCFGNKKWFNIFPGSNQTFLAKRGSDHRPVLVNLVASKEAYRGCFRFDKRFLNKPDVKEAINQAWNSSVLRHGLSGFDEKVSDKLRLCRKVLSRWKRENSSNSSDCITSLQQQLEVEQSSNFPNAQKFKEIKYNLCKAYREEEEFWRQKSQEKWVQGGDKNTKFFHASVKANRGKKRIDKLKDINGNMQKSEASKGEVAVAYFNDLFTCSNPDNFQSLFYDLVPRVNSLMNYELAKTVSKEEIYEAVYSIRASSAPGADGFTGLFFQRFWKVIGEKVTNEVRGFFVSGIMPGEWNYTQLCLLPKTRNPYQMCDLRPISLCSVMYKIIAKVLVKRVQPFLPMIVSPNQSAFVAERHISDNILIAHELVHGLRTHSTISKDFMAVKSDMSKAYDRVE
ncbi:hypothetical protein V5N11_016987 [Cardamine amara subsp. amara]|uniref:Reverse transcriptase domain-containing protein n=1 Tax=Cardamine amara subsp. amara TaxID=228776 RepID=A0ABD1BIS3_CARAN